MHLVQAYAINDVEEYNTVTRPDNLIPIEDADTIHSSSGKDVLLIQKVAPWNTVTNEQILINLSLPYKKVTAAQASTEGFESYRLIMVANDQDTNFYRNLSLIRTKLEQYVINGGVVIYGVCDGGWASGESGLLIPGDVELGPMTYARNNYIHDNNHPIVTGEATGGTPLVNRDLYSNYASHRIFNPTSLPYDANIILHAGTVDKPTLIEYTIGNGLVIASTLTWEHNYLYHTGGTGYGTFARKAYDDLIVYAYSLGAFLKIVNSQNLGVENINNGTSCAIGDPVDASTGNYVTGKTDISIDGKAPLSITRYYNAMGNHQGNLGFNWYHTYDIKALRLSDRRIRVIFEDGHTEDFIHGDDGVWFSSHDKYKEIGINETGFYFVTKELVGYTFDSSSNLIKIVDSKNNVTDLEYIDGRLFRSVQRVVF